MKQLLLVIILFASIVTVSAQKGSVLLPNGWSLSPAGTDIPVGDLPLNMVFSPDGSLIAVTQNGFGTQGITLIDAKADTVLQIVELHEAWLGLAFSGNGKKLYASGGNDNCIWVFAVKNKKIQLVDSIILGKKWPEKISPAGIAMDYARNILWVVTKENNALYRVDVATGKSELALKLSAEAYTCLVSPATGDVYISIWGDEKVLVYDPHKKEITDSFRVGKNPNDMVMTANSGYLFVANAVDNSVSVINLKKKVVVATLDAAIYEGAPSGSTTNSVALSRDNKTLYIANADNNCLAVFDVSDPHHYHSEGFIPVGWYPTCVRTSGNKIFVLDGKGTQSMANPKGPQPVRREGSATYKKGNKKSDQYIGGLFKGDLRVIPAPDGAKLARYSLQVYANSPYHKDTVRQPDIQKDNVIPAGKGEQSPIKHVFYVIKENRTYDQVLGDEPEGNGDTSLVLFGRKYTPNQHRLVEDFVLLDNFFVDAEVSADGHNWSTAAYANDYVEKTWPTNYSGRGGTYDYAANKKVALPRNGFLWDYAFRAGVSFRDYGEFTDDDGNVFLPELDKHMCHRYTGWDLSVKDIDREKVWEQDFDSLVAANVVPALNILYFPSDHTAGLGKKSRTPFAFVADNDLAVGTFMDHLSHSAIWSNCVVFILEDDAQNGPDHVDAHRSTAYVAGPYVKRAFVDHTMYSTSGLLHTIELILGLPPMSQYDAAAQPMYQCFTPDPTNAPFTAVPETIDMDEKNTALGPVPDEGRELDLSSPDRIPDDLLNRVLWYAVRHNDHCPVPRHAAFVNVVKGKDDDD